MDINEISGAVVDAAIAVHTELGPGLLESAYEACLMYELSSRGYSVLNQVALPIKYKGIDISTAYRIDLLVENLLIVELRTVEKMLPVHEAQLLSYLKLSNKKIGLLINFNCQRLKYGIKRLIN